jgi:hypothetical protein
MEPPDPEAYRDWSYEQLLALARRAQAEARSNAPEHSELGRLKAELGALGRRPGSIDELPAEDRARFDELVAQIKAYPIDDPWGHEGIAS